MIVSNTTVATAIRLGAAVCTWAGMASAVHAATVTTTYAYDALGRLTQVGDTTSASVSYLYDEAGNRIQATGPNVCPNANNDFYVVYKNTVTNLTVTTNDSDPDDDVLIVVIPNPGDSGAPGHGTITVKSDGRTIKYTPDTNFIGVDSFTYTLTDGQCPSPDTATVSISIPACSERWEILAYARMT